MMDVNNNLIKNDDGIYKIVKVGKLCEELCEVNIVIGLEYWYNSVFVFCGGYFYEYIIKGGCQFFIVGIGLQYNMFGIDIFYLVVLCRNNLFVNIFCFIFCLKLGQKKVDDLNEVFEQ